MYKYQKGAGPPLLAGPAEDFHPGDFKIGTKVSIDTPAVCLQFYAERTATTSQLSRPQTSQLPGLAKESEGQLGRGIRAGNGYG